MNFKCYRIISRLNKMASVTLPFEIGDIVVKELGSFIDEFDVFKISVNRDAEKFGVRNLDNNDEINLKIELGEKELTSICFVVIDRKVNCQYVYFDGRKKDVVTILQSFYQIKENDFASDVSIEDLAYIQKLRITERAVGQMNFDDPTDIERGMKEIHELFESGTTPEKIVHEYEYSASEGRKFRKQKLGDYIDSIKSSNLKKIYIEGRDKKGNIMSYDEHFNRKLTVLDNDENLKWEVRNKMSLELLKNEIKSIEKHR